MEESQRHPSVSSSIGDDDISVLPESFDQKTVAWTEAPKCQICSSQFGKLISGKHHCRYCGKAVCEDCSNARRQLSIIDKKKYRICDQCDESLIATKVRQAFERLLYQKMEDLKNKESKLNKLKTEMEDMRNRMSHMDNKVHHIMQNQTHKKEFEQKKQMLEERKKKSDESVMLYKKNKLHNTKQSENISKIKEENSNELSKLTLKLTDLYTHYRDRYRIKHARTISAT